MKIGNIYSQPKETKDCLLCGKEIDRKWKDDLCEACRDNVEFNPKLKEIGQIFKTNNHQKDDGGSQMAKTKQNKEKPEVGELGKRVAIVFFENEMPDIVKGLKLDKGARPKEVSNAIRKLVGVPEVTITKATKRKAVIEKLGLSADASQKEINQAILDLELE